MRERQQTKNAAVQMLEADVFKITVNEVHRAFKGTGLPSEILLLVHGGIWFGRPDDRAAGALVNQEIRKTMENSVRLSVPHEAELI